MNLTNFYTSTFGTTELWRLNLGFYLEEALRNQTHDEVIRFLYRNFEFSENVTDDRKFMMLALKNSNPDITRLYLDNCGDK